MAPQAQRLWSSVDEKEEAEWVGSDDGRIKVDMDDTDGPSTSLADKMKTQESPANHHHLMEEGKILERVSRITISADSWPETQSEPTNAAAEVSFTTDDEGEDIEIGSTDDILISSPSARVLVPCTLVSSPLRTTRSKRKNQCMQTPITLSSDVTYPTPKVCNGPFGPRRKKRRPGSLADAPRIPDSPALDRTSNNFLHPPCFSPFRQEQDQSNHHHLPYRSLYSPPTTPVLQYSRNNEDSPLLMPTFLCAQPDNMPCNISPLSPDARDEFRLEIATNRRRRRLLRVRVKPREDESHKQLSSIESCYSPILPKL